MTSMMSASTADDTTQQSIPSFTSFSAELEPSWDYYEQQQQQQQRSSTERSSSAPHAITDVNSPQPTANGSYTRPWEMDTKDNRMAPPSGPPGTPGPPAPATPGAYPDHYPKLPSFQSQFHSFTDTTLVAGEPSLPQVTAVPVPISPSSASPVGTGGSLTQLTQLTPTPLPPLQGGFHTLSAVNSRPYPIVPGAIPVRELAGINQHQYIDERHIQLYQPMATFQGQTLPTLTVIKKELDYEMPTLNNGATLHHANFQNPLLDNGLFAAQNGTVHHIQHQQAQLQHHHHLQQQAQQQQQQQQQHHVQQQTTTLVSISTPIGGQQQQQQQTHPQQQLHHHQHNLITPSDHHNNNNNNNNNNGKLSSSSGGGGAHEPGTPAQITRIDNRKKERRKMRAPSLESSAESEGSAMEIGDSGNPGQVAAISSTANFKSPMHSTMSMDTDDGGIVGEKSTKKKRKRCGECIGCSRKDNCGDCAPCRNDKSHQICKTRRCEKLTEKKILYGPDGQLLKPESRRGRGKGSKSKAAAAGAAAGATNGTNGSANGAIVSYDANGQAVRADGKRGRGRGRGGGSGRGRKALNLGATPKNVPQNAAVSPAPASLPHPSPNTTTGTPSTPNVQVQANQQAQQQQQQQQQQLVTVSGAQTGTAAPPTAASTAAAPPGLLVGGGQSQHQHQQHQHQQQAQLQQHLARHPPIPGAPPPGGGGGGGPGTGIQQVSGRAPQQLQPHHSILIKTDTDAEMKDQPQQPMAPMAFYPTWQADPSQGWQNQFIQQIPQNTPAITPLNSLEFQPQGYAAYQPNGYVQTAGIGFDPNYGRTYAAPPAVQRYDFQANQIAPINQVSLQSVSFAPTVTYAGQVSTGPATIVSHNNPHDQFNLQLSASKQQQQQQQQQQQSSTAASAASGNDMPGYPRVNSVPPRSLNCNGYSGQQDYGGHQTTTTTTTVAGATGTSNGSSSSTSTSSASIASPSSASAVATVASNNNNSASGTSSSSSTGGSVMHPPQGGGVPQSPNRNTLQQQPPRPNSNQQLYAQQSPNPYSTTTSSGSNNNGNGSSSLQQSPSHNGNNGSAGAGYSSSQGSGSQGPSGMHTPSPMGATANDNQLQQSPSHMQQQSEWVWNQQQQQQQQQPAGGDLFNQSDRVNLNSRLKTMIMNKGDSKDILQQPQHMGSGQQHLAHQQQTGPGGQQATGHFLSYSHHLRDSLTPTHLSAPGPGTPGAPGGSTANASQQMMAAGGGAGGGSNGNSSNNNSSTTNEGTAIGDGGGSLINSIGNIVDPTWKSSASGSGNNSNGSNSNSSANNTAIPGGMKSPLGDQHHHHHQQQQQQHHHHHMHHEHLLGGVGGTDHLGHLHGSKQHPVFEQKQQLIDKNNTDPGGGGSPGSDLKPGKMGKGSGSSSSSSSSGGGSPSAKSKGKGGEKHGKSKHGNHHNHHQQQQQQHQQHQQHHLDPMGMDSKSSSSGYGSGGSNSSFLMHHDQHQLHQQQQYGAAPTMNQTYPGGSTTPNGSQSSTTSSLLGGVYAGGSSSSSSSSMMVDSKLLVDDKSPLNRFRHDSLASGFNPHLQGSGGGGGTGSTGGVGAFHHPSTHHHHQAAGSNYNLMSVKKEPGLGLDDGGQQSALPKFDGGYEKNYQNFIRYGDYCDNTSQSSSAQAGLAAGGGVGASSKASAAQDYNSYYSPYGSYGSYSSQSYPNYHQQSAAVAATGGFGNGGGSASNSNSNSSLPPTEASSLLSLPAITTPVAHQTNFEQQIPAHTYPIPKNSSLLPSAGDVPIKLETDDAAAYGGLGGGAASLGADPCPTNNDPVGVVPEEVPPQVEPQPPPATAAPTPTATGGGTTTTTKSKSKKGEKKDKSKDANSHAADGETKAEGTTTATTTSKSKSKKESKSVKKEPLDPAQKADDDKLEKSHKPEAPDCDCFSSSTDKAPSEPGSYYTHLGCAATLEDLRRETELRVGLTGKQLRIEKVVYTGKEGKSSQGCPIAKWVIRRVDPDEKLLFVVKRRQGHRCKASFIVICIVVWDGIPQHEADSVYRMLSVKLNKFGLPTVRRCATNENRTCACQGLDPEMCGVSYSFGCSWSMYYNGCKYARSKTVRKFRLSVKNEEAEIEERMNVLATMLSPLYVTVAPQAFQNQVQYEREAPDCRLGLKPGKPFSGVTCCLDFCAHTHRDLHNMQDGCTVQVTLLKPLPPGVKPDDEQLHVLPLYTMDTTDEFDSEEGQKKKHETGAVQVLEKFQTEVRVRSTPLQPCRRHGKKRGNGKDEKLGKDGSDGAAPDTPPPPPPPTKKESKSKSKKSSQAASAGGGSSSGGASNGAGSPGASAGGSGGGQNTSGNSSGSGSPRAHTPGSQKSSGSGGKTTTTALDPVTGILAEKTSSPLHGQQGGIGAVGGGGLVAAGNNGGSGTSAFTAPNTINSPNSANQNTNSTLIDMASMIDNFTDAQLQSNQISSTVLDSPYSYDYNTGQYIDNRQYYNNWPTDYYGNRGDPSKLAGLGRNEEIPDTTTRPGSNSSNSAFSPSIPDPTKTPTPIHMDDYGSTKLAQQQQQHQHQQQHQVQQQVHQHQQQQQQQQQTQNTYHTLQQPEQGFVKPKPPDYNPAGYGYHHPNTAMGYGYHHHHHPPYHHTPYDPYQNYNYGYPPQSYHHHHHATYHNMYPAAAAAAAQTQLPGTGPAPPPPPTAVIPAPPPPSNWNLYPPHIASTPSSAAAQLHVAAAAVGALGGVPGGKQSDLVGGMQQQSAAAAAAAQVPPAAPLAPKETLGEVTETNENVDCFEDPQMGGVAIALPHGSVIIECAKLEMHSTTAVKKPNRLNPTRMTLIFYQHRNLNRPKHGIAEWAEKMRLKKLGIPTNDPIDDKDMLLEDDIKAEPLDELHHMRHLGDEHDMMDVEYPGV